MFWKKDKIDNKQIMNIRPSSKISLKQQCLIVSKGDLEMATKMYDYFAKDIDDLPTYDIIPPSTMQQVKDGAIQTFSWLNNNQDQVMNWIGIIKQMFGNGGNGGVPPTQTPIQPIPSIN